VTTGLIYKKRFTCKEEEAGKAWFSLMKETPKAMRDDDEEEEK